jgi:hypothetical protein
MPGTIEQEDKWEPQPYWIPREVKTKKNKLVGQNGTSKCLGKQYRQKDVISDLRRR